MTTRHLTRPRAVLGVLLVAAVAAVGAYAFTASNTVPDSNAGSGTSTVAGYTASAITYTLTAADPSTVDTIAFTINPTTATAVKVKAISTGAWKSCTNTSGSVSCDYTAAPISLASIDQLAVIAVQ